MRLDLTRRRKARRERRRRNKLDERKFSSFPSFSASVFFYFPLNKISRHHSNRGELVLSESAFLRRITVSVKDQEMNIVIKYLEAINAHFVKIIDDFSSPRSSSRLICSTGEGGVTCHSSAKKELEVICFPFQHRERELCSAESNNIEQQFINMVQQEECQST